MKNVIFKVLGKIKWEDIEVGKVFAIKGCWIICYKTTKDKSVILTSDDGGVFDTGNGVVKNGGWMDSFPLNIWKDSLYELPENVQNLFITN